MTSICDQLTEHLRSIWQTSEITSVRWTLGPIERSLPGFVVLRVAPTVEGQPWVYVSAGASRIPCFGDERFEFFITAVRDSPAHIETLAMACHFHADERYRLHLGKIVDIGRPWDDGSQLHHLLVSLPYPYGPRLEHCKVGGSPVRLFWLLPISATEADYAIANGVESLEREFDRLGIDYLDNQRPSVV